MKWKESNDNQQLRTSFRLACKDLTYCNQVGRSLLTVLASFQTENTVSLLCFAFRGSQRTEGYRTASWEGDDGKQCCNTGSCQGNRGADKRRLKRASTVVVCRCTALSPCFNTITQTRDGIHSSACMRHVTCGRRLSTQTSSKGQLIDLI